MKQFDEIELDALREILNIGVGYAADSFSRMVGATVTLSVPQLHFLCGENACGKIHSLSVEVGRGNIIRQRFQSNFMSDAVLMFPSDACMELVQMMVGKGIPIDEIHELERDALTEVGNILFNSCLSVISNMTKLPFECQIPRFESGHLTHMMKEFDTSEDCLLMMQVEFTVQNSVVHGYLMFLMKLKNVDSFLTATKKYFGLQS